MVKLSRFFSALCGLEKYQKVAGSPEKSGCPSINPFLTDLSQA